MFRINWKASGLWAFAKQPRQTRTGKIAAIVKAVHIKVLSRYASGNMTPSLKDRFSPMAFARYQLSKRKMAYRQRQIKVLGNVYPYYSPRSRNYAKLAQAAIKGNAMAMVRALSDVVGRQAHMRDIIHRPGTGYRVVSKGQKIVKTTLRLPGANILNKGGARFKGYRAELTDLTRGGGRDSKAILAAIHDETAQELKLSIEQMPPAILQVAS